MWEGHIQRVEHIYRELDRNRQDLFSLSGVKEYLDAATSDFQVLIHRLHQESRPHSALEYPRHRIKHSLSEYFIFHAGVGWAPEQMDVNINLSLGTLLSLDDLFLRLACNGDFFAFDTANQGKRLWNGCRCAWFSAVGSFFPNARFYDYRQRLREAAIGGEGTFLSGFLQGFPLDQERQVIAFFMLDVAMLWILMHEEGHYENGHLGYLLTIPSHKDQQLGIDESAKVGNLELQQNYLSKVMEWQADRNATRAVIDMFFRQGFLSMLPSYCGHDRIAWLFRLLIISMGCVIQVIQKARVLNGSADDYPSPRTRLLSVVEAAIGRIANPRSDILNTPHSQTREWPGPLEDLHASIVGALDDLHTVTTLINKDGEVTSFNPGRHPEIEQTRRQELLETPTEAKRLAELVTLDFLPREILDRMMDEPRYRSYLSLHRKWFAELHDLIRMHDTHVWDLMSPHRLATGSGSA